MKAFSYEMINPMYYQNFPRKPDFNNLLKVIKRETPSRPTLFEFSFNEFIQDELVGSESNLIKKNINAFCCAGYDYVSVRPSNFLLFPNTSHNKNDKYKSISLNENCFITDRESFENYIWPEPDDYDWSS